MRVRAACGLWCVLAAAGCGSGGPPPRAPARPAHPVPCPRSAGGDEPAPAGWFDARALLGMPLDGAEGVAKRHGCELRVASRDGKGSTLGGDSQFNRVDVDLIDGKVAGVAFG